MRIVILGPPGAGKGTQAKAICSKFTIPHISTGDIFRRHISKGTSLGIEAKKYIDEGLLVPDNITINLVIDRLVQEDCKNGFLLDGFPRTVVQAKALDSFLEKSGHKLDTALLINLPKNFIIERMSGRRICPSCGASYHIKFNPSSIEGKCDVCGNNVIQRKDDKEETVIERIEIYEEETGPLIEYYRDKDLLDIVDGTQTINDVFNNICRILGEVDK